MSDAQGQFTQLGRRLKYARQQSNLSLSEVSGAVEIEENYLEKIEAGQERPSEDILLLLINYFGIKESDAVSLWELADYSEDAPAQIKIDADQLQKSVIMLIASDPRTVYSDGLEVFSTKAGVTMEFTQATGQDKSTSVARVGMSLDQAAQVVQQLQVAILKGRYSSNRKTLPPSTD